MNLPISAVGMHHHQLERSHAFQSRVRHHVLKHGAFIVGCRGTGFDIFPGDNMPVPLRPLPHLAQLTGIDSSFSA